MCVCLVRLCKCRRRRWECFVVRYQGHAVPRLLDLLGRKLLSLLRNTRGALAASLNCNPLSYQRGFASLASLKSRSCGGVIPAVMPPWGLLAQPFRVNMFGRTHILPYTLFVCFSHVCFNCLFSFTQLSLLNINTKKLVELMTFLPISDLLVGHFESPFASFSAQRFKSPKHFLAQDRDANSQFINLSLVDWPCQSITD